MASPILDIFLNSRPGSRLWSVLSTTFANVSWATSGCPAKSTMSGFKITGPVDFCQPSHPLPLINRVYVLSLEGETPGTRHRYYPIRSLSLLSQIKACSYPGIKITWETSLSAFFLWGDCKFFDHLQPTAHVFSLVSK